MHCLHPLRRSDVPSTLANGFYIYMPYVPGAISYSRAPVQGRVVDQFFYNPMHALRVADSNPLSCDDGPSMVMDSTVEMESQFFLF